MKEERNSYDKRDDRYLSNNKGEKSYDRRDDKYSSDKQDGKSSRD